MVVGGEHRRRGADGVRQRHREERRAFGPPRERHPVEVAQGLPHRVLQMRGRPDEAGDVGERGVVGEGDRPADVTHERHVRHGAGQADPHRGRQPCDGQRQVAALRSSGDEQPGGVHEAMTGRHLEHPHRVGDEPAVVVGLRRRDALGHGAGRAELPRGHVRVRGPLEHARRVPALASIVQIELRVAGRGEHRGQRHAARDRVPVVADDGGQRAAGAGGDVQPRLDGRAAEAGEREVVGVDQRLPVVDQGLREQLRRGIRGEGLSPEGVEARGFGHLGLVGAQGIEREIELGHGWNSIHQPFRTP